MFCQILGVCGTDSGLNETLDGNLDPDTMDSILKNGTIPKS